MSTPTEENRPDDDRAGSQHLTACAGNIESKCVAAQQVRWWDVHQFVAFTLAQAQPWPTVGTVEWCALADDDPRKLAALLDAAQHWALRLETCQQARCDASREISDALDWSALAREINQRTDFYAARPWLKRVVS